MRERPWAVAVGLCLAGAVAVLGFAPFYFWPAAIASLAALFLCVVRAASKKPAALFGFAWGMGLFAAGVSWLFVSLHEFGGMPTPLAAFFVALFCAYVALFPLLAAVLARALITRLRASPQVALLVVLPACFVASEMLRAWFLTGFPWLVIGYSQTPGGFLPAPLTGLAPLFGAFGISWVLAMTAGAVALALTRALDARTGIGILVGWAAIIAAGLIVWSTPRGAPISVALLQGNIAQSMKWRADQVIPTLQSYRDLVVRSPAKLVVMPETALPVGYQEADQDYVGQMRAALVARGGDLITGVVAFDTKPDEPRMQVAYNSAISVGTSPMHRYDKKHLVVFGEFVPEMLAFVMSWLNIPMSSLGRGHATPEPMQIAGTKIAVNICYEDAFGSEIAQQLPAAELLVNVSNMAWFGNSLAAAQQAQFSQMRSLETARWSLRSTNTGLTAAINERGEIVQALPQYTRAVLEVAAQPRVGITPYVRWRDWPVLIGLFSVIGWCVARASRRERVAAPGRTP